jgi:hypothetical protein
MMGKSTADFLWPFKDQRRLRRSLWHTNLHLTNRTATYKAPKQTKPHKRPTACPYIEFVPKAYDKSTAVLPLRKRQNGCSTPNGLNTDARNALISFPGLHACFQNANRRTGKPYSSTATSACARPGRASTGQAMGGSSQLEPRSVERKRPLLFPG